MSVEQNPNAPKEAACELTERYWLTVFKLSRTALQEFATLDSRQSLSTAIAENSFDVTSEADVYQDERNNQIHVALSARGSDQLTALADSIKSLWLGAEAQQVVRPLHIDEVRMVPMDKLGDTLWSDAWLFMEDGQVDSEQLQRVRLAIREERQATGTFLE